MITTINEMKKRLYKKSKTKIIKESLNMNQKFVPSNYGFTTKNIIDDFIYDFNKRKDNNDIDHEVTELGLNTVIDQDFMYSNLTEKICQEYVDFDNNDLDDQNHINRYRTNFIYAFFMNIGLYKYDENL